MYLPSQQYRYCPPLAVFVKQTKKHQITDVLLVELAGLNPRPRDNESGFYMRSPFSDFFSPKHRNGQERLVEQPVVLAPVTRLVPESVQIM